MYLNLQSILWIFYELQLLSHLKHDIDRGLPIQSINFKILLNYKTNLNRYTHLQTDLLSHKKSLK